MGRFPLLLAFLWTISVSAVTPRYASTFHGKRRHIQRGSYGQSHRTPMAIAIPGNSLPEEIFVGGSLNALNIYNYLITGRILLSWFPQAMGIPALRPLFLVTDPFLNLFRGLGLNFAGLDFSVVPAFFLLSATTNAVAALGCDMIPLEKSVSVAPTPLPSKDDKTEDCDLFRL